MLSSLVLDFISVLVKSCVSLLQRTNMLTVFIICHKFTTEQLCHFSET